MTLDRNFLTSLAAPCWRARPATRNPKGAPAAAEARRSGILVQGSRPVSARARQGVLQQRHDRRDAEGGTRPDGGASAQDGDRRRRLGLQAGRRSGLRATAPCRRSAARPRACSTPSVTRSRSTENVTAAMSYIAAGLDDRTGQRDPDQRPGASRRTMSVAERGKRRRRHGADGPHSEAGGGRGRK